MLTKQTHTHPVEVIGLIQILLAQLKIDTADSKFLENNLWFKQTYYCLGYMQLGGHASLLWQLKWPWLVKAVYRWNGFNKWFTHGFTLKEKTNKQKKNLEAGDMLKNTRYFFSHTHDMQKFPCQGSNPCLSSNQSHRGDNMGSLTH